MLHWSMAPNIDKSAGAVVALIMPTTTYICVALILAPFLAYTWGRAIQHFFSEFQEKSRLLPRSASWHQPLFFNQQEFESTSFEAFNEFCFVPRGLVHSQLRRIQASMSVSSHSRPIGNVFGAIVCASRSYLVVLQRGRSPVRL